jgi:predicted transcriptional regulator
MATLSELTVQILTARMAKKDLSLEEIQKEMVAISNMIKAIDSGALQEPETVLEAPAPEEPPKPQKINYKKIFKDNEVICLICNKGFKTLKRHLKLAHDISDKEYRAQFNIPAKQSLVAKAYSEERKKAAIDRGQGDILVKAREAKKAGAKPAKQAKAPNIEPEQSK